MIRQAPASGFARIMGLHGLLLFVLLLLLGTPILAQENVYWRNESATGDWEYGTECGTPVANDHWWNASTSTTNYRPDCGATPRIVHFDNLNPFQSDMRLNGLSDYTINQIIFDAGVLDRNLNPEDLASPRSLYFKNYSGTDATIENKIGGTTHTFNVNVNIEESTTFMQIRVVDGYLVFNETVVNNSGNTLNLRGNNNMHIYFNGPLLSQGGTSPGVTLWGENAVTVVYGGDPESKNYSGPTTIKSGATLQISSNQTLGELVLESGGILVVNTGITLTITGSWTGGGTIENNGTIVLAGTAAQSFPGPTSTIAAMNNLTINNSSGVLLDRDMTVDGTLSLANGRFILGSNHLTLGAASPAVAGSFNSNNMIVADNSGTLRKTFSAPGSYFFPVGDLTSGADYSPLSLNFTLGSFAPNAYAAVRLSDAKHPNNQNTNNYLTRYWRVTSSGIASFSCNLSANYVPADVVGSFTGMVTGQWTGSLPWIKHEALTANSIAANGLTSFSDFTGISDELPIVDITADPGLTVCQNEALSLMATASGDAPLTYLWSPGGETTPAISPSTATPGSIIYTVTVTDGNGFTATDQVTVIVVPLPSTSVIYHN